MIKILPPILIFCLAFPASMLAEPPATVPVPKITGIKKGDPAPFSGVLLNSLAAAKLFTEKNYSVTECDLRVSYEVKRELARVNIILESSKASMDSMEQKYTAIIKIKDTEIERLSSIALKPRSNYSTLWAVGGVLVGIGLTIAVVYAVGELK